MVPGKNSRIGKLLSHPLSGEVHRYIWSGALAFAADFLVLFACTEYLGVNYLLSNVFGFTTGLLISYVLAIKWVFRYRKLKRAQLEFALFTAFALLSLASNELAIWLLVEALGIYYLLSKVAAAAFTFLFNFALKKIFLFSKGVETGPVA